MALFFWGYFPTVFTGPWMQMSEKNPDDAFVLYSYAYEEFGKALIIKDCIKKKKALGDGLWLHLTSVLFFLKREDKDSILKEFNLKQEESIFQNMKQK